MVLLKMIQMLSKNTGNYSVQEDNSEWDEKVATPDLFEAED
jgi:hypothetical protein